MSKPYGQLFWDRIDRFPPIMLRLMARLPRGRALESVEIAERSGLSVVQVDAISQQTDWRGVDLPTAKAFMIGCGTDLSDRAHCRRIMMYLKHKPKTPEGRFAHVRRSANFESFYKPLLVRLSIHLKSKCRR